MAEQEAHEQQDHKPSDQSWHLDQYKNRNDKVVDYSSGEEKQPDTRYLFYYDGKQKVIFEPNREMLKAMQLVAPRKVFTD